MKLQLTKNELLTPLQRVIGVIENKQAIPILANVLLTVDNQKLSLTGTDLEIELIGQSELAEKNENVRVTLPGKKLMDICRALPENAAMQISEEKHRLVLKSGRSRFTLATLPAADFPNVEEQQGSLTFSIQQKSLKRLIQKTSFAMAQQDVRYYLNGMLLEIESNCIRAVATDGHRLALNSLELGLNQDNKLQVIIPRKGVLELSRLLEERDDYVNVTIGTNHIQVRNQDFTFTSKLVDGRFPDYAKVLPHGGKNELIIDRDIFKAALNRASILSSEKFRGVRVELESGVLKLSATNPEQEAAEDEVEVDYDGENIEVGFNINYLIDVTNTASTEKLRLTFTNGDSSVLIDEVDNKSEVESLFVVMPMRL